MRRVLFKKWVPRQMETIEGRLPRVAEGTNCWEKEFSTEGLFHQWAPKYDEYENSAGNYTVALVELQDGTIEEVLPFNLKFEDKIIPDFDYTNICSSFVPNIGLTSATKCIHCGREKWEHYNHK
jgi:hypothetical protein